LITRECDKPCDAALVQYSRARGNVSFSNITEVRPETVVNIKADIKVNSKHWNYIIFQNIISSSFLTTPLTVVTCFLSQYFLKLIQERFW